MWCVRVDAGQGSDNVRVHCEQEFRTKTCLAGERWAKRQRCTRGMRGSKYRHGGGGRGVPPKAIFNFFPSAILDLLNDLNHTQLLYMYSKCIIRWVDVSIDSIKAKYSSYASNLLRDSCRFDHWQMEGGYHVGFGGCPTSLY